MEGGASFLEVAAPEHATVGQSFPLRIRVSRLNEPSHLCVDLHWATGHNTPQGLLAFGGIQPVAQQGGAFTFAIAVPPTNGLRFVTAILYFSPTGDWKDRTFAAQTDLIPVSAGVAATNLTRVTLHVVDPLTPPAASAHFDLRRVTALVWLIAMFVALSACYSRSRWGGKTSPDARWWLILSAGFAVAGGWEWFGLESHLGDPVRAWAHAKDVYYLRGWVQKGTISLAIAATIGLLFFAARQRSAFRRPLVWLVVSVAISFINLLSLHSIDRYAGLSWDGVTLIDTLKLACATVTLHSVVRGMRQLPAQS